jgi:hypothetical protein
VDCTLRREGAGSSSSGGGGGGSPVGGGTGSESAGQQSQHAPEAPQPVGETRPITKMPTQDFWSRRYTRREPLIFLSHLTAKKWILPPLGTLSTMSLLDAAIRNVQRAEARFVALEAELEQIYKCPPSDFRAAAIVITRAQMKRAIEALRFHAECVEANRRWMGSPSPSNG